MRIERDTCTCRFDFSYDMTLYSAIVRKSYTVVVVELSSFLMLWPRTCETMKMLRISFQCGLNDKHVLVDLIFLMIWHCTRRLFGNHISIPWYKVFKRTVLFYLFIVRSRNETKMISSSQKSNNLHCLLYDTAPWISFDSIIIKNTLW